MFATRFNFFRIKVLSLFLFTLFSASVYSEESQALSTPSLSNQSLSVVASIKPLQMITHEITKGVTETQVLLGNNTSPHDYALRPSDVKTMRSADLFIWMGQDMESFLVSELENKPNALRLDQVDSIDKKAYEGAHDHGHEGHDHGVYDLHLWLGPIQAQQMAKAIGDKLIEIDPTHKAQYEQNYQAFISNLNQTVTEIKQALEPVKGHGYYVFHDAYNYFESYFSLNKLGHFTVSPDRRPGAKALINIRKTLKAENVHCVFAEPQFKPTVIESTIRGTDVKQGELDPLATEIEVKDGSYFEFLQSLSTSFSSCLASE